MAASTTTRRSRSKRGVVPNAAEDPNHQDNDNEPEKKFTLSQMYHSYFVPIKENRFANPKIHEYVKSIAKMDSNSLDESTSYLSLTEYNSIKLPTVSVKLTSDHPKQKFSGFSRYGLFLTSPVSRDRFIIEYAGLVMSPTQYKSFPINQYRHFGCPKPGVLFHSTLPIVVDARKVGSDARFLRRSCQPNCKVCTVIVDDTHVVFAVFPLEHLKANTELTIPWEWDPQHPVRKLLDGSSTLDQLSKEERNFLVHSADMIQQRGSDCACNLPAGECALGKMKKALGNPLRITRTGAKTRAARNSILDGPANLLEEHDRSLQHLHPEHSDDPPSISFYSKREARKLQNAMALIEKLNKDPQQKRRKHDSEDLDQYSTSGEDDSFEPDNKRPRSFRNDDGNSKQKKFKSDKSSNSPEQEEKPFTCDKSIQTNPLLVPLRKNQSLHSPIPNPLEISTKNEMVYMPRRRILSKYMFSKQFLEPPTSLSSPGWPAPVLKSAESQQNASGSNLSIVASKILGRPVPIKISSPTITEPRRRPSTYWQPSTASASSLSRVASLSHISSYGISSSTSSGATFSSKASSNNNFNNLHITNPSSLTATSALKSARTPKPTTAITPRYTKFKSSSPSSPPTSLKRTISGTLLSEKLNGVAKASSNDNNNNNDNDRPSKQVNGNQTNSSTGNEKSSKSLASLPDKPKFDAKVTTESSTTARNSNIDSNSNNGSDELKPPTIKKNDSKNETALSVASTEISKSQSFKSSLTEPPKVSESLKPAVPSNNSTLTAKSKNVEESKVQKTNGNIQSNGSINSNSDPRPLADDPKSKNSQSSSLLPKASTSEVTGTLSRASSVSAPKLDSLGASAPDTLTQSQPYTKPTTVATPLSSATIPETANRTTNGSTTPPSLPSLSSNPDDDSQTSIGNSHNNDGVATNNTTTSNSKTNIGTNKVSKPSALSNTIPGKPFKKKLSFADYQKKKNAK